MTEGRGAAGSGSEERHDLAFVAFLRAAGPSSEEEIREGFGAPSGLLTAWLSSALARRLIVRDLDGRFLPTSLGLRVLDEQPVGHIEVSLPVRERALKSRLRGLVHRVARSHR